MWQQAALALFLVMYPGLVLANPKCVVTDWTQAANYLDWGSCNWPNQGTPCGPVVNVPGKSAGQRAWPFGTCTLKFTRTPWAPSIYPQEKDNTWICGTRFMVCTRPIGNVATPNATLETLECGGKVAGTERPCPDDLSGWNCTASSKQYPDSNCKSDGPDLVLDVSTMGYPEQVRVSRVADADQCAQMCVFKPGCNLYVFCNSPNGCGWSCQEYYEKLHKKAVFPLAAIIGIVAGGVLLICIATILTVWCVCRRRPRSSSQIPVHQMPPPTPPAKAPETPPLKSETSHPHSNVSSPPIPAGFHTATVGYPFQTTTEHEDRLSPMHSAGLMGPPVGAHGPTRFPAETAQHGFGTYSAGGTPSPASRPGPRRFLFTGSSESSSEASSSIYPLQHPQGGTWSQAAGGAQGLPPRQQRGANHAVL